MKRVPPLLAQSSWQLLLSLKLSVKYKNITYPCCRSRETHEEASASVLEVERREQLRRSEDRIDLWHRRLSLDALVWRLYSPWFCFPPARRRTDVALNLQSAANMCRFACAHDTRIGHRARPPLYVLLCTLQVKNESGSSRERISHQPPRWKFEHSRRLGSGTLNQ